MDSLHIMLPVNPTSCPRPRVSRFGTYYPKAYKDFQNNTKDYLTRSVKKEEAELIAGATALHIDYIFVFYRPQYLQKNKYPTGRLVHNKRPDLDNLIKAINDSLQAAGIISDDAIIFSCMGSKYYAAANESASIQITIKKGF